MATLIFTILTLFQLHAREAVESDGRHVEPAEENYQAWKRANGENSRMWTIDLRFSDLSPDSMSTLNMVNLPAGAKGGKGSTTGKVPVGHFPVLEHLEATDAKTAIKLACEKFKMGMSYEKKVIVFDCVNDDNSWDVGNGEIKQSCLSKDQPKKKGKDQIFAAPGEKGQPRVKGFILRHGSDSNSPIICGEGSTPGKLGDCSCPPQATS